MHSCPFETQKISKIQEATVAMKTYFSQMIACLKEKKNVLKWYFQIIFGYKVHGSYPLGQDGSHPGECRLPTKTQQVDKSTGTPQITLIFGSWFVFSGPI